MQHGNIRVMIFFFYIYPVQFSTSTSRCTSNYRDLFGGVASGHLFYLFCNDFKIFKKKNNYKETRSTIKAETWMALASLIFRKLYYQIAGISIQIFFPSLSKCGNMAREGLRTLVVAKKSLSEEQYQDFEVGMTLCLLHTMFSFSSPHNVTFLISVFFITL